jgi:hypothetical protein
MLQKPPIDMCIRDFREQLKAVMALHYREIERYLQEGIERALARIGEAIIEEAATLVIQNIHEGVKHDLLYGEGGQAIKGVVHRRLSPLAAILLKTSRGDGHDAAPGTSV